MKKIAIWGWWQGNNLGDNWIKKVMAKNFPYAEFIDTSIYDFSEYDFVICGGGGLFIYDAIRPWREYTQDTPFGMIGLGAEFPHSTGITKSLSEKATFFYVRDEYSIKCMNLSMDSRSYDITFSQPLDWVDLKEVSLSEVIFIWRDGYKLTSNEKFKEYIKYEDVYTNWSDILKNNFEAVYEDDFQTRDDDIELRMDKGGFVVSGRYHGIVAAIQKGLPFIAIDICPKIRALLQEVGLEDYCIKVSELDKVDGLIKKARNSLKEIREKESLFRTKAHELLRTQIKNAEMSIFKTIHPFKILHYGSYWMKENDVVNTMSDDLGKIADLIKIDLKIYEKEINGRVKTKLSTPNGCLCILDGDMIIKDIKNFSPDVIILNSGGLTMEDSAFRYAKSNGITTVGISLSDPDVFPYNGQLYAHKFDIFYTNSKHSLVKDYDQSKVNIKRLPFAASMEHHFFMDEIERRYDVVIVGHARRERKEIVKKLSEFCSVATYGYGWDNSLGVVNGAEHVKAINSGKLYLSFSKTMAGYNNVKVGLFEAVACKQVVITEYMDELNDYFEIGKEVICFSNEDELIDQIHYLLENEDVREEIRNNSYRKFLSSHTYIERWREVLKDMYYIKHRTV